MTEQRYIGPGDTIPDKKYTFTGNAHEEWDDFFQSAYRFCVWAENYVKESGYDPEQDCVIKYKVMGLSRHELCPNPYEADGSECADGITIWAPNGFDAPMWGEFVAFVLHKLPCCYPDGDLTITPQGGRGEDGLVLHLWHD